MLKLLKSALIGQGTKQKTEIMLVFCLEIFLPTGEQLVPRLKGHDGILKTKVPFPLMKLMKSKSGPVLC